MRHGKEGEKETKRQKIGPSLHILLSYSEGKYSDEFETSALNIKN